MMVEKGEKKIVYDGGERKGRKLEFMIVDRSSTTRNNLPPLPYGIKEEKPGPGEEPTLIPSWEMDIILLLYRVSIHVFMPLDITNSIQYLGMALCMPKIWLYLIFLSNIWHVKILEITYLCLFK